MKQFFAITRGNHRVWNQKTEEEWMALARERMPWIGTLGEFTSAKLASLPSVVLERKNGKTEVFQAPFDDSKETIIGVFILHARNMDHAVEMMKPCPWLVHDKVEIFECEF